MEKKTVQELTDIRILGRTTFCEGALNLFWTGSGLDFCFDGSVLSLHLSSDYMFFEAWLSVEIDGTVLARFPVQKGESTICLLRGLMRGTRHRVRIFKDTQAMHDDSLHFLQILGLEYRGEILPPPAAEKRIEFIGDSVTSGEGAIGAPEGQDWISAYFSSYHNYSRMTADALHADYRCLSQSGWGVLSAWDNNPHQVLPQYYGQICGLVGGEHNLAAGAHATYDFSSWKTDIVVVNLGANDDAAFDRPEWRDKKSGESFQEHLLPDGSYDPADAERLRQAVKDFLKKIRKCNPDAFIVWCYGMLGHRLTGLLDKAVGEYRTESGDLRAYYLMLPDTTPETIGARSHPGVKSHAAASKTLVKFIREHFNGTD